MPDSSIAITGGTSLDPFSGHSIKADVYVENGRQTSSAGPQPLQIHAHDLLVAPGLIDVHVHLREPGFEQAETISSGTAAAVAGGFAAVACMPNTTPALNGPVELACVSAAEASCRVYPIACLTRDRAGQTLIDYEAARDAGAVAFSDDGTGVASDALMAEAFRRIAEIDGLVIQHCEVEDFQHGVMHLGAVSRKLGVSGIDPLSEELMIARDLVLAERYGARYHVAHISTARAVELVRRAKRDGIPVTTEVCPHHLLLTDEACRGLDPNYKMHPPLREPTDVEACIAGVLDGTIDCLVTDHAPHPASSKNKGFEAAPPGIIGVESSLALCADALVHTKRIDWMELVRLMSTAPANVLRIPGGRLGVGHPADITLIDPEAEWTIDVDRFASKSRNCPFHGRNVKGKAVLTIVDGEIRYVDERARGRIVRSGG